MKPYLRSLRIFAATAACYLLVLHPLLFGACLGHPIERERYLDDWWQRKEAYARSIPGRKLVLLSGSNTLFGVNAARMEDELGIPTVNFGLHAGLFYYILERAEKSLHPGDIVLLPLEYAYYDFEPWRPSQEYLDYIRAYDSDAFLALPLPEQLSFVCRTSPLDLLKGIAERLRPPAPKESFYSAKYLDANGDMTHHPSASRLPAANLLAKAKPQVFAVPDVPTAAARERLRRFLAFCRAQQVTVYVTWPNFFWPEKTFSGSDAAGIAAIHSFWQEEGVEVLGRYEDALYDADLFFDTVYHLNDIGAERRTADLIALLKGRL